MPLAEIRTCNGIHSVVLLCAAERRLAPTAIDTGIEAGYASIPRSEEFNLTLAITSSRASQCTRLTSVS